MTNTPTIRGGPWTQHGHPIPGVTVYGTGPRRVARCGGPRVCARCADDAAAIIAAGINTDRVIAAAIEYVDERTNPAPDATMRRIRLANLAAAVRDYRLAAR